MKNRFRLGGLALGAVFLLIACSHLPWRTDDLRVNIADITPKEMKLFEQIFAMELRIMNPTDKELVIKGMVFDLEVNGQPFARGVSNQGFTVGPFASHIVKVEAVTTLASLLKQVIQAQKEEFSGFTYRLKGFFEPESSSFRIPFDEQGEFKRGT